MCSNCWWFMFAWTHWSRQNWFRNLVIYSLVIFFVKRPITPLNCIVGTHCIYSVITSWYRLRCRPYWSNVGYNEGLNCCLSRSVKLACSWKLGIYLCIHECKTESSTTIFECSTKCLTKSAFWVQNCYT